MKVKVDRTLVEVDTGRLASAVQVLVRFYEETEEAQSHNGLTQFMVGVEAVLKKMLDDLGIIRGASFSSGEDANAEHTSKIADSIRVSDFLNLCRNVGIDEHKAVMLKEFLYVPINKKDRGV